MNKLVGTDAGLHQGPDHRAVPSGGQSRPVCFRKPREVPLDDSLARLRALHFPPEPDAGWGEPSAEWSAVCAEEAAKREERDAAEYSHLLATKPDYWADLEFVNNLALEFLPAVVAELDYGLVCGMWEPGEVRWWPPHEPGWVLAVAEPGTDGPMVYIDRASGWWVVGRWERQGPNLVHLAAWRWGLRQTKAAWRLARLCGLQRPVR